MMMDTKINAKNTIKHKKYDLSEYLNVIMLLILKHYFSILSSIFQNFDTAC